MATAETATRKQEARSWAHSAIEAQCHWSASMGWIHSKFCDQLTESRIMGARVASAVLLLRRVRAEENLPSDEGRQFELDDDIDAFLRGEDAT